MKEEWDKLLRNLKTNTALGYSQISYEIIKKSSMLMKDLLRRFINILIFFAILLNKWSKGIIYPIPKTEDWNLDLTKTRPITLLECSRKIFFKVLTNRLTEILSKHRNVLENFNYVTLSGCSTIKPINILNNIIEDARENKKELWLIFQDMLKVYDYINRKNLSKSLERIKLPSKFIEIIKN